jgi:hypothetical protein
MLKISRKTIKLVLMLVITTWILFNICYADAVSVKNLMNFSEKWQISASVGTQISGIKDEDFVRSNYSPLIEIPSGYFYNFDYKRPNICANIGIAYNYLLINNLYCNFKISSIMGWDIYQGDQDILPSISVGIGKIY